MKKLCVYCTRSRNTEKLAESYAKKTGAELLYITDGKDRSGVGGYFTAAVSCIFSKPPKLLPYKPELKIEDYDKITLATPIWCEGMCPMAKSFLMENKNKIKGETEIVLTHMSDIPYTEKAEKFCKKIGVKCSLILSFKTKKNDYIKELSEKLK